jgi:hypothetical protein
MSRRLMRTATLTSDHRNWSAVRPDNVLRLLWITTSQHHLPLPRQYFHHVALIPPDYNCYPLSLLVERHAAETVVIPSTRVSWTPE